MCWRCCTVCTSGSRRWIVSTSGFSCAVQCCGRRESARGHSFRSWRNWCTRLGTAAHALTTLAHFSQNKSAAAAGYVPADARDRLQGDYPSGRRRLRWPRHCLWGRTTGTTISRTSPLPGKPLIAPRVSTPVGESPVPDEVDYLIVGSGAGGATMAYRLACNSSECSGDRTGSAIFRHAGFQRQRTGDGPEAV